MREVSADDVTTGRVQGGTESGFALILAILALMLLTFLGLTLATSTSQELQIASNHRWNQQALYNAEAGIEVGKAILRDVSWEEVLPERRMINPTTPDTWTVPDYLTSSSSPAACPNCTDTTDASGRTLRNFENAPCDAQGGQTGYGNILNDGTASPYQYVTTVFGQSVNGAFTIWVRRLTEAANTGEIQDSSDNEQLIMTVEGIAPYRAEQATLGISQSNRAVKLIEYTVSREARENTACATRAGQAGGGPEGANFGGCVTMDAGRVAEGLGIGGTLTDTGAQ